MGQLAEAFPAASDRFQGVQAFAQGAGGIHQFGGLGGHAGEAGDALALDQAHRLLWVPLVHQGQGGAAGQALQEIRL